MNNLDFSKIASEVLAKNHFEEKISEYKLFYMAYLRGFQNRNEVLNKLYSIYEKYKKEAPKTSIYTDRERISLESEAENVIKKYFKPGVFELYNKEIPKPKPKREIDFDKSIWYALLTGFATTLETISEKYKQEWNYRTNFLFFLYNCLLQYGLHPDILRRDPKVYKRYNFIVEHFFRSRNKIVECKILQSPEILEEEYLTPYENKLPIRLKGKLIPFKSIYSIKITSTLLLDDEIELYAEKSNLIWNKSKRDEEGFSSICLDETENFHKNPYLIKEKEKFKNQKIHFVDILRIQELKSIKNKGYDLAKLVQLCEELNRNSGSTNNFSSSLLVRAIIDHIPPIFGFKTFSQLANNYTEGTKSFKKAMLNLDNSLRNIADNNIHSQIRAKEVLPTLTQIDFSPELDLLLSEIIRKLK